MTQVPAGAMTRLTAADGHELDCWIHPAQGDRRGGLVILQEIFGVTDQLKSVARIYAEQGFEVAIPALFDRKQPNAVIPFDQGPVGREIMLALDVGENLLDIAAAVEALGGEAGTALIGYCWGGGLAFKGAQEMSVAGSIAFYGTRLQQFMDKPMRAPMLMHFGSKDDHSPPELIDSLREKYSDVEIHLYDAGHAFANDARPAAYVRDAAKLAHERNKAFLDRVLPP